MYALNFLNDQDIIKVQSYFENSIGDWLANYSFSKNYKAEISHVSVKEIEEKNGIKYVKENGELISIFTGGTDSEWQKIIFGNLWHLCPEGEKLNQLLENLRTDFYSNVLTVGKKYLGERKVSLLSIDAFLCLRISIENVELINLYASHSFFASVIGKDALSKSLVKLRSIKDAITPTKVPVSFKLNFGAVPFEKIVKMEVGTILKSNHEMDNTFSMNLNGIPIANVSMGKMKDNIAFLVKGK